MRRTSLAILWMVVSLGGCAAAVKTEGQSGPIAWRATDMGTVTRSIAGQAVDTYEFTLVIKNVSDRTIVFTRMDRTVYQAGGGDPGRGSREGPWALRPGVERRFPLYTYTRCTSPRGCEDRGGAQPLWQIVFTGVDDQDRPLESRFEVRLPPRSAPIYVQVSPATRRAPSPDLPAEGSVIPAPTPDQPATQVIARATSSSLTVEAPTWRRGDEWEFRTDSSTGKGAYVWTVDREETIDGVPTYVIRTGTREIFYRKADIATLRETVEGRTVLTHSPARLRYVWPLGVGKTWEQPIHEERPTEPRTTERVDVVTVEAEETVTVPAGTFRTLKIVYRNKGTQAIRYEEWYAPELKQPVLLREHLSSGLRVRELTGFRFEDAR